MRKLMFGLAPLLAVAAFVMTSAAAQAQTWTPAGASIVLDSSNLVFEVVNSGGGTTTLTCGATIAEATLGSPAKATFTTTPSFSICTAPAVGLGTWTAKAIAAEEATLAIPAGGAEIEVTGTCKIIVEASTLGTGIKDYKAGTNGKTKPSVWTFTKETVNIKDNPVNCFSTATTAKVSATIDVLNLTSNIAVKA
jgi:hypothetical protein